MVGLDHGPATADEPEDEAAAVRHARLGRKLFVAYLALYIGYVWMVAFRPDLMRKLPWGGINTAVLYGFGLIATALVTALAYGWMCRITPAKAQERS